MAAIGRRGGLAALAAMVAPSLAGVGSLRRARAAEWPDRPVRFVIPFGAGGPIDSVGRLLGEKLREALGQPFVVDNRPGGGGSIGIRAVAQAPADGASFLLTSASLASIPALYPGQGLDPREGLAPVSLVSEVPTLMVVRAESPWRDVAAVIAEARRRPGELTYGSGGAGSSNHLAGALFARSAGVELTHVSYRGAAASVTALYAGEIDLVFTSSVESLGHIRAGRIRALGVTTAERVALLPAIPAVAETVPGYVALNWYAIAAPRATPAPVLARMGAALARLRDDPEVRSRFAAVATEPLLLGPDALAARLERDIPLWARVVAEAGIRVE
jgi:tripartite-type tricarboxylate transporter receptor subunit TctC